jgi:hypothetical protein
MGIAYGGWLVFANASETRPVNMAVFLLGLLLLHDLVIAPVTIAIAAAVRPRLPRVARGAVAGAAMTSAVMIALVLPAAIGREGKVADNPTVVPRDPWASVAIVLAIVWLVAGAVMARRFAHDRTHAPSAEPERAQGAPT